MKQVMAMLAVLAVAGMVYALDGGAVLKTTTVATSQPAMMAGAFVKVDGAKMTVTVKEAGKAVEKTVLTTDKTTVTVGGKEGKLADLKEGMLVKVTLDSAAAEPTATKIDAAAVATATTKPVEK
jgi:hypothetical protein